VRRIESHGTLTARPKIPLRRRLALRSVTLLGTRRSPLTLSLTGVGLEEPTGAANAAEFH